MLGVLTPGSEGSTFGGYPLASVVGTFAIKVMIDAKLAENAKIRGDQLMKNLDNIKDQFPDKIMEVRGKGFSNGWPHNKSKVSGTGAEIEGVHIDFSRSIFSFMSNNYESGWLGRFEVWEFFPGLKRNKF